LIRMSSSHAGWLGLWVLCGLLAAEEAVQAVEG